MTRKKTKNHPQEKKMMPSIASIIIMIIDNSDNDSIDIKNLDKHIRKHWSHINNLREPFSAVPIVDPRNSIQQRRNSLLSPENNNNVIVSKNNRRK